MEIESVSLGNNTEIREWMIKIIIEAFSSWEDNDKNSIQILKQERLVHDDIMLHELAVFQIGDSKSSSLFWQGNVKSQTCTCM